MTYHKFWEERISNEDLKLADRVWAVAMARSKPNLHTPLGDDELAELVGKKMPNGETKPAARKSVWEAINKLIDSGLLDKNSTRKCLILPAEGFGNRRRGWKADCKNCTGKLSEENKDLIRPRHVGRFSYLSASSA